jgi:hypothetical protein
MKVSSIVLSTGHLFPGTKDLATLMAPHFNKYVAPGWDISMFSKNTEKKLQISSIIFPSKTEKEITHQEKTPGIKKEVGSFNSFSQL